MMTDELADFASAMRTAVDLSDLEEVEKFTGTGFRWAAGHMIAVQRLPMFAWADGGGGPVELGPDGFKPWAIDRSKPGLYITPAGTPHHVPRGYGYWHVNPADEIYVWSVGATPQDFMNMVVLERERRPGEQDKIAWYCPNCTSLVHAVTVTCGENPKLAWDQTVAVEREAVRDFNRNQKLRICGECGTEHPPAYRLMGLPPNEEVEDQVNRFLW